MQRGGSRYDDNGGYNSRSENYQRSSEYGQPHGQQQQSPRQLNAPHPDKQFNRQFISQPQQKYNKYSDYANRYDRSASGEQRGLKRPAKSSPWQEQSQTKRFAPARVPMVFDPVPRPRAPLTSVRAPKPTPAPIQQCPSATQLDRKIDPVGIPTAGSRGERALSRAAKNKINNAVSIIMREIKKLYFLPTKKIEMETFQYYAMRITVTKVLKKLLINKPIPSPIEIHQMYRNIYTINEDLRLFKSMLALTEDDYKSKFLKEEEEHLMGRIGIAQANEFMTVANETMAMATVAGQTVAKGTIANTNIAEENVAKKTVANTNIAKETAAKKTDELTAQGYLEEKFLNTLTGKLTDIFEKVIKIYAEEAAEKAEADSPSNGEKAEQQAVDKIDKPEAMVKADEPGAKVSSTVHEGVSMTQPAVPSTSVEKKELSKSDLQAFEALVDRTLPQLLPWYKNFILSIIARDPAFIKFDFKVKERRKRKRSMRRAAKRAFLAGAISLEGNAKHVKTDAPIAGSVNCADATESRLLVTNKIATPILPATVSGRRSEDGIPIALGTASVKLDLQPVVKPVQLESPKFVKIFGIPELPPRATMQQFLQQFELTSVKKHRSIDNLLVVGVLGDKLQLLLQHDGHSIGNKLLDMFPASKDWNNQKKQVRSTDKIDIAHGATDTDKISRDIINDEDAKVTVNLADERVTSSQIIDSREETFEDALKNVSNEIEELLKSIKEADDADSADNVDATLEDVKVTGNNVHEIRDDADISEDNAYKIRNSFTPMQNSDDIDMTINDSKENAVATSEDIEVTQNNADKTGDCAVETAKKADEPGDNDDETEGSANTLGDSLTSIKESEDSAENVDKTSKAVEVTGNTSDKTKDDADEIGDNVDETVHNNDPSDDNINKIGDSLTLIKESDDADSAEIVNANSEDRKVTENNVDKTEGDYDETGDNAIKTRDNDNQTEDNTNKIGDSSIKEFDDAANRDNFDASSEDVKVTENKTDATGDYADETEDNTHETEDIANEIGNSLTSIEKSYNAASADNVYATSEEVEITGNNADETGHNANETQNNDNNTDDNADETGVNPEKSQENIAETVNYDEKSLDSDRITAINVEKTSKSIEETDNQVQKNKNSKQKGDKAKEAEGPDTPAGAVRRRSCRLTKKNETHP